MIRLPNGWLRYARASSSSGTSSMDVNPMMRT
jgi:hypothetical protein